MRGFVLNRGSTIDFKLNWPNGDLGFADLTGFTVDAFEPHVALAAHLTLTITDAPTGEITGRIVWNVGMPDGDDMDFRIRVSNGSAVTTTNRLPVMVQ